MVQQRVFKEKGVTSLPGYEAAFNTAVLVHTELKKKHPDRYKKLAEGVFKVKNHPDFAERAKKLNIDKVAVWYSSERAEEIRAKALKDYKANKWIIDEMKKNAHGGRRRVQVRQLCWAESLPLKPEVQQRSPPCWVGCRRVSQRRIGTGQGEGETESHGSYCAREG
jgi:hypothetical protein